jgi:hypothetical protein
MSCDIKTVFTAQLNCLILIEEGGNVILEQLHDNAEVNPSVRDICRNILDILEEERWE